MKAKISRLARGIFEENNMELFTSVRALTGECMTDSFMGGSFTIMTSAAIGSTKEVRGVVCSDNGNRIIIENETFVGNEAVINYRVSAVGLAAGEKIQGTVAVVSNCGEFSMPCEFDVVDEYIMSSVGKISNLFHFANLVQQNYDEALAVFTNESFERIFIKDNLNLQAVYEGLVRGRDIKNALEEFLIYANKKKRLTYTLKGTEADGRYEDVSANFADKLIIQKSGWGYGRLHIKTDGDFITAAKNILTTEEFVGNSYELSYLIDYTKLHAGNNYGSITVSVHDMELVYNITVHQGGIQSDDTVRTIKKSILELTDKYFGFRMKKMSTDSWARYSMQLIEIMSELDDSNDFVKLLRAQILIAEKKPEEAVGFINEVGSRLRAGKKKQEFLYCYYLYVRTLYSKNTAVTKDAIEEIEEFYKKSHDVRIMWILLYLDEEYMVNKSLRLARIKEQYAKDARSPFFYYEACAVFNEQPGLLRVLNYFEIQALWWGCRNGMINIKLAEQLARLVSAERKFNPVLFRVMEYVCDKFNKTELLEVLCRYVVANTAPNRKYFKWYEKGVVEGFEFDGLYEAYMNTLERTDEAIPNSVALYFAYNGELECDRKAFLFANVLKNESQYSGIIKNYVAQIKTFARGQLDKGNISEDLAYIYKRVLEKSDINRNNAQNILDIQLTKMLTCKADILRKHLSAVIIRHKELNKESYYKPEDGVVYFTEYSDDVAILFEDEYGDRYVAEAGDYECRGLLNQVHYVKKGLELAPESLENALYIIEKKSGHYNKNLTVLYECIIKSDEVKLRYRNYIYRRMIDYYSDNNDGDRLDYYLKNADVKSLEPRERTKVLELFLIQGLYNEAYELIKQHGYDNISTNRLMRLCTIRLREQDMLKEDTFFTGLCTYVFNCSKYGEAILLYLLKFYVGSTRALFRLWSASKDFGVDTTSIEGRLIVQMLFTEVYLADSMDVFESYYAKCRGDIVTRAYFNSRTYLYLAQDMVIDERIFACIEKEYIGGYELSDIGKMALLKYYSEQEELNDKAFGIAKLFVEELHKKGYIFAFYNRFAEKFALPFALRDKLILEYKTGKGKYVELKYMFDSEETEEVTYHTEVMEESFEGTYARPFVIFYGEKLKYYISENEEAEAGLTESGTREMLSLNMEGEPGRYGLLNEICSARELKDEQTLIEAMKEYEKKVRFVEEFFLPIVEE